MMTTSFAVIGLIISLISYEYEISRNRGPIDSKKYPNPMLHPRNNSNFSQISKLIVVFTTIIAIFYHYKKNQLRA